MPGHQPKSVESVERLHESAFSSVARILCPFVAKEVAMRGPGGYSWLTEPPASGKGSWSMREVKKGKTGMPSAKWDIPRVVVRAIESV
jgi:hypothetical protein